MKLKPILLIAVVAIVAYEFVWAGGLKLRGYIFKS